MKGHLRTAVISALIGACAATATIAVAGTGVGGVFNLGQTNSVDATTRLQGAAASGAQLAVTNTSTSGPALGLNVTNNSSTSPAVQATNGAGGTSVQANSTTGFAVNAQSGSSLLPALRASNTGGFPAASFVTNNGVAPFRVNSSTVVAGLNADKVDGKDASQLGGNPTPALIYTNTTPFSFSGSSATGPPCEVKQPGTFDVTVSEIGGGLGGYAQFLGKMTFGHYATTDSDPNDMDIQLYEPATGDCYRIGVLSPPCCGPPQLTNVVVPIGVSGLNLTPGTHTLQFAFGNVEGGQYSVDFTVSDERMVVFSPPAW